MSTRNRPWGAAACAIGTVGTILVLVLPADGAEPKGGEAGLAWQGCWEPDTESEDDAQDPSHERQLVCLAPGEGLRSLTLTALVGDEVIRQHTLFTDGIRRAVSEGGCSGWRRAFLSEDGRRLFMRAESICEGGNKSAQSGVSLMVSRDHWVDIHVRSVGGERELVIRHFRPLVPGSASLPGGLISARHAARLLAAVPLTADDVIESLQFVDSAVVEAMLLESDARFRMDSRLLLRLDDAGVPDEIVDLMVALSFPEYFAVRDEAPRPPSMTHMHYWTPWFSTHGYGFGHYYPYPHPPVTDPPGAHPGGRVVSGHGYTRVEPTQLPPEGFSGFMQRVSESSGGGGGFGAGGSGASGGGGSGGGDSSAASSSGYQSGGSNTGRTAVPR